MIIPLVALGQGDQGWTPLHEAGNKGQIAAVRFLAGKGVSLDARSADGSTPLHLACWGSHSDCAKTLAELGSKVNLSNKQGWAPLHVAASVGLVASIKILLERGAPVDAATTKRETPLHLAAKGGHKEAVRVLLQAKANAGAADERGWTALHEAVAAGATECVAMLVPACDVEAITVGPEGQRAIHLAVAAGHTGCLTLLLHRCDPLARDATGRTALHSAALSKRDIAGVTECAQMLLEAGVPVDTRAQSGETALMDAARSDNGKIVSLLIDHRADTGAADSRGNTALHLAISNGSSMVIVILIENGAPLNAANKDGNTPLHEVARNPLLSSAAYFLMKSGASLDARNALGQTPAEIALKCNNENCLSSMSKFGISKDTSATADAIALHAAVRAADISTIQNLATKNKCDINGTREGGVTSLHVASYQGHPAIVETLLELGANVHLVDSEKRTALHMACQAGAVACIRILRTLHSY